MASYKQLSKGNWKVAISLGYKDGKKQIIRKQGFKTKKEAEIYAAEILNQKNKGYLAPVSSNNILFKDFILKWFDEYKSKTIGINTFSRYKSSINNYIIPNLGSYKLTELNNMIIQDFYNKLISIGQKPATVKKTLEVINGCLKYAKNLKLIYNLPTEIQKMKIVKPMIEYWTKDELAYFLKQIQNHYLYKPVFISVLTGVRIAELCGIQWKDINFEKGTIIINGQVLFNKDTKELVYTSILKTDSAFRIISIPPILIDYLNLIKKDLCPSENDYIILDRNGNLCTPKNLSANFSKVLCKYKKSIDEIIAEGKIVPDNYMQLKQISFHGLRHTHATLLILNGDNIKSVSERLGHKDITTTLNTYTHVMKEMRENTSTLLQNIFAEIIP